MASKEWDEVEVEATAIIGKSTETIVVATTIMPEMVAWITAEDMDMTTVEEVSMQEIIQGDTTPIQQITPEGPNKTGLCRIGQQEADLPEVYFLC